MKNPFQALLDMWKMPAIDALIKRDLEQAEREVLAHRNAAEFHDAMTVCLESRIDRLQKQLHLRDATIERIELPADLQGFSTLRKAA